MTHRVTIKDLPKTERPYEKCILLGAKYLSDAELLAVILRTGSKNSDAIHIAQNLLNYSTEYPGLLVIHHLTAQELMQLDGIGQVKAVQLLCLSELTKRMSRATRKEGIRLLSPDAVANYYMEDMRHLTTEQIRLIMIDSKSKIINDMIVSKGTVNSSLLNPREIYLNALRYGAVNIILIHNHPSGDPTPSSEDLVATRRMKEAGQIIGIKLMDHIIIGDNKYVSLKEKGLL